MDRQAAKGAATGRELSDPELAVALSEASMLQLRLAQEQNRHRETMRGAFAKLVGQGDNTPTYVAAIGMIGGVVTAILCLVAAGQSAGQAEFWGLHAERALAFSATCLAFVFGKGISKT